jgi:benzoate transport
MNRPADSNPDTSQPLSVSRLSRYQIVTIMVCVGLNMLDGFDVLVMSLTAPGVSAEWTLSGRALGVLFSAGLVGMAAGSLVIAPRADRYGRRPVVLISLFLVGVGMLATGVAQSYPLLTLLRVISGIGIGGVLACTTVLVAEYSSGSWRSTATFLYTCGYSLGGTLGGTVAAVLIGNYGWRSAYIFGGLASTLMLPMAIWRLPESLDFLLTRRPKGALCKLNRLLTKMERDNIDSLPRLQSNLEHPATTPIRDLFAPALVRQTSLLFTAFVFMMAGYYFVFSWTPQLMLASGMSTRQGIGGGVMLSLGGIIGTAISAFIARRIDVRRLTFICLIASIGLMELFAVSIGRVSMAFPSGVALGAMTTCTLAGLYVLTPTLYSADLRTSGMGWAIGVGRIGAIMAPLATGALVDSGWHAKQLYCLFASTFVVAAFAVAAMSKSKMQRAFACR